MTSTLPLGPALVIFTLPCRAPGLHAQEPHVAPEAPDDRPVEVPGDAEQRRLDSALAPSIARARATYPGPRRRHPAGLPQRQSFLVTVHLRDEAGRRETVFLAVDSLTRDSVYGRIWNERGFRLKDPVRGAEEEILDWLITRPEGSEEGNFVGQEA